MATIEIVDLRVRTIIGTNSWERKNKQELVLNITLEYDASKASRSDNLKDALDYYKIAQDVTKTVENSKCYLLERLSIKIKDKLKEYKTLQSGSVRIEKPQAIADARTVSYTISF